MQVRQYAKCFTDTGNSYRKVSKNYDLFRIIVSKIMKRRESGGSESEPSTKKPNLDDKKKQFLDGAEYFLHSAALRETPLSENNLSLLLTGAGA
jgi:hypothetical protein